MVNATLAFHEAIRAKQAKLKKAAIRIAFFSSIPPDATRDAIAFGASVAPFTKIVPKTKKVVTWRGGFPASLFKNSPNDNPDISGNIAIVIFPLSTGSPAATSYFNISGIGKDYA